MTRALRPDQTSPSPLWNSARRFCVVSLCMAIALVGACAPAHAFSGYDKDYRDSAYGRDRRDNWERNHQDHNSARDNSGCRDDGCRDVNLDKESGANPQQTPFDDYLRRQAARDNRSDQQAKDALKARADMNRHATDHFDRQDANLHDKVDFGNPGF